MAIPATVTTILLDQVHSAFWTFQPDWPWTLADLTAISLVDGTQDYAHVMTNFYRFTALRINRTDITPNLSRPLDIVEHLEPDVQTKGNQDTIRCACWLPTVSKIRLETAVGITSPTTLTITGEYQKLPTKIVSANLTTAFAHPDIYLDVMTEGLLYKLYKYTDDDRAGAISVNKLGQRQYTGQLGIWMQKLQEAVEAEDMGSGQAQRFPSEPLGVMRGSYPGPVY